MKTQLKLVSILFLVGGSLFANEESREHSPTEETQEKSSVGPNKGILKASEHEGFQLSKEALKNFAIETITLDAQNKLEIPSSAILLSGEEKSIFRLRGDFFKRVDFTILKQNSGFVTIKGDDLRAGDRIAITGVAFLRIAEITAFGGAETSHSH